MDTGPAPPCLFCLRQQPVAPRIGAYCADTKRVPVTLHQRSTNPRRNWFLAVASATAALLMAACRSSTPPAEKADGQRPSENPLPGPVAAGDADAATAYQRPPGPSAATTPRAYRQDAAGHLYALHSDRLFKGKLPPLLYAIGVLQTDLDSTGRVVRLNWLRAPRHAPEVVKEIEKIVRQAAPFPAPARMGKVTYTETWLWHKSGQFQLDTLTEGQL